MTLDIGRARALLAAALATATLALAPLPVLSSAFAAPADPAAARVDGFDSALIETMKSGAASGVKGRARKLTPAVEAAFDLPTMTRFAVGPAWAQMIPAQQAALIAAFTRLTVNSYAHNFASYGGERFELDADVQTRGADKIVHSRLIPAHDKPVNLIYRMRQTPEGWKIIDVYYDGVSQLTTRRADFAQPVSKGGAEGLLSHLNALSDKLLR